MTQARAVVLLAELLGQYLDPDEFSELAAVFDVEVWWPAGSKGWITVSRAVLENINTGNHRALVDALVEQLEIRNSSAVVNTGFERRQHHESLSSKVYHLRELLGEPEVAREVSIPESREFAAKSEFREFLGHAETEVFLIDPYVGVGTLDCLRDVNQEMRLLTGTRDNSVEDGFERVLDKFRAEGRSIEVRRHERLHDRHVCFNERCWLIGSSLKDAGRKAFNCIEIRDERAAVLSDLEQKWTDAAPL